MVAYIFKNEQEKAEFQAYIYEQLSDFDMFEFVKCVGVRFTLNGDLHLIHHSDYKSLELVSSLDNFILMCN